MIDHRRHFRHVDTTAFLSLEYMRLHDSIAQIPWKEKGLEYFYAGMFHVKHSGMAVNLKTAASNPAACGGVVLPAGIEPTTAP